MVLLTGCAKSNVHKLLEEPIKTFEVIEETAIPENTTSPITTSDVSQNSTNDNTNDISQSLDEKFSLIEFNIVSGNYCRNVTADDVKYTEMFVGKKNNFIRVAINDVEQEVFAYNYVSDDFTYLYYYDGELMSKTVFNLKTGEILEDPEEYASLLQTEAEEIKIYFNELLQASGIALEELDIL
jgi:hypothetical protein